MVSMTTTHVLIVNNGSLVHHSLLINHIENMYTNEEKIIVIMSEFFSLASIPLNEIMIRYLKNKPPGMQTFLDSILIDIHRTFQILSFLHHTTYSMALYLAPFHKILGDYLY